MWARLTWLYNSSEFQIAKFNKKLHHFASRSLFLRIQSWNKWCQLSWYFQTHWTILLELGQIRKISRSVTLERRPSVCQISRTFHSKTLQDKTLKGHYKAKSMMCKTDWQRSLPWKWSRQLKLEKKTKSSLRQTLSTKNSKQSQLVML